MWSTSNSTHVNDTGNPLLGVTFTTPPCGKDIRVGPEKEVPVMVKVREVHRNAGWMSVSKGIIEIYSHLGRWMRNKIPRQEKMGTGKASESCCCGSVLHRCLANILGVKECPLWSHAWSCSALILPYSWSRSAQKFLSVSVQQMLCFIQALLHPCQQAITDPGRDSPAEAKLSWSCEMPYKEETRCRNHAESKGEVTDCKYSSSWTVLKHLSRNLSKNPYPSLHCSKLTYHIKCIHFCNSYPNALYAELFPPHHTPPPGLFSTSVTAGQISLISTCFRRHSGVTLPISFSITRSLKLSWTGNPYKRRLITLVSFSLIRCSSWHYSSHQTVCPKPALINRQ